MTGLFRQPESTHARIRLYQNQTLSEDVIPIPG